MTAIPTQSLRALAADALPVRVVTAVAHGPMAKETMSCFWPWYLTTSAKPTPGAFAEAEQLARTLGVVERPGGWMRHGTRDAVAALPMSFRGPAKTIETLDRGADNVVRTWDEALELGRKLIGTEDTRRGPVLRAIVETSDGLHWVTTPVGVGDLERVAKRGVKASNYLRPTPSNGDAAWTVTRSELARSLPEQAFAPGDRRVVGLVSGSHSWDLRGQEEGVLTLARL